MRDFNRRQVVTGAVGAVVAAAARSSSVHAAPNPAALVTRQSVGSMAVDDPILQSYRIAIEKMKALPETDPRNWTRQARIHEDFCPHGNWLFLPWHRAYLAAFERIIRQMSDNPNFSLPYWDWTADRQIPSAFTTPQFEGRPNPLFDNTRVMTSWDSLPDSIVGPETISQILAETAFENFGSTRPEGQNNTDATWLKEDGTVGPLEGRPHNGVHVTIGGEQGNMGGFLSPLDPIFWLHHCNVDRLWSHWVSLGRQNTNDPLWLRFPFNNQFVIPQGATTAPYAVSTADVLNTTALGYNYTTEQTTPEALVAAKSFNPNQLRVIAQVANTDVARLNRPLVMATTLTPDQSNTILRVQTDNLRVRRRESATSALPVGGDRVLARIVNVAAVRPGRALVHVFVNCPYLSANTPTTDPHYAGTFGLFALRGHAGHGGTPSFMVELTPALTKLRRAQRELGGRLAVQLMPVAVAGAAPDVEFKPARVDIAVV